MIELKIDNSVPEDFNNEPVHYCNECLSLNIRVFTENTNYCDDCGNTETETTHIEEWEKLYELKYKQNFLKTKKKKY